MPYTCTKTFDCISTAHRNWRAEFNESRDSRKCAYIHGYTKTFTFVFGCDSLDDFQWVYDYGTSSKDDTNKRTMTKIKDFIQNQLDHSVTTDSDDPKLKLLNDMQDNGLIKLIVIPCENGQSGSVEGLCRYFYNSFDPLIRKETNDRVWIESVTISEHHKNSSTYSREDAKKEIDYSELSKMILNNENINNLLSLFKSTTNKNIDILSIFNFINKNIKK